MPVMISGNNAWTLNGPTAELHRGPLAAHIDVSRPDLGLRQLRLNGRDLPGHLLAVERHNESPAQASAWPLPLADAYVRGNDLVATYQPTNDWPYAPQLYWSTGPVEGVDPLLASVSLLISVQTHLLDTWPSITVRSQFAGQELLQVNSDIGTSGSLQPNQTIRPSTATCCVLHRTDQLPFSYLELMPASDFRELTVRPVASGYQAEWHLFADFLEKGVIRKARLQSVFVPRENDVQIALDCCAALERRPLPLTT